MTNLGLTDSQAAMLDRILCGEPLGKRTAAQTYVLRNLRRAGVIRWDGGDVVTVNEAWRVCWAEREGR